MHAQVSKNYKPKDIGHGRYLSSCLGEKFSWEATV